MLAMIPRAIAALLLAAAGSTAFGRDLDGRYANSPLHQWVEGLHSKAGAWCCDEADGETDIEWRTEGDHYQVHLRGQWIDVPPEAVVEVQNRLGRAMVWPVYGDDGIVVRCFMPGSLT